MRLHVAVLAAAMLSFGAINTLTTKLQDGVQVGTDAAGEPIYFKHPWFQTATMFLGEAACLAPFLARRAARRRERGGGAPLLEGRHGRAALAFALPAALDAVGSTCLNLGLFYTYASTYQMLRGTLVVWAAAFTALLLRRRLHAQHLLGCVLIAAGAALVGAASVVFRHKRSAHPHSAPDPALGAALVVAAQAAAALQFVVEERLLAAHRAPVLLAVGAEGVWGLVFCVAALPALAAARGRGGAPLDSLRAAAAEVAASPLLAASTAGVAASIAAFNLAGVSVTKRLSGASRAAIDAARTLLVWLGSIALGWEQFRGLQLVGFAVLLTGTSVYNDLLAAWLPPAGRGVRADGGSGGNGDGADGEGGGSGPLPPPPPSSPSSSSSGGALEEPLLTAEEAEPAAARAQRPGGGLPRPRSRVTFAEQPASAAPARPVRIGGGRGPRPRVTMARSITLLPGALSPRSLASGFGGAAPAGRSGDSYDDSLPLSDRGLADDEDTGSDADSLRR